MLLIFTDAIHIRGNEPKQISTAEEQLEAFCSTLFGYYHLIFR